MPLVDSSSKAKQKVVFAAGFFQQVGNKAKDVEAFHTQLMKAVWDSGYIEVQLPNGQKQKVLVGLTPEEKIEALGTDAAAAFNVASLLAQLIVAADPTAADRLAKVPDEYANRLDFKQDGTVSVSPAA